MKAFNPLIELQVKILTLFLNREPQHFSNMVDEYVVMLKELVTISVKRYHGKITPSQTLTLNAFTAQDPIELAENCTLKMEGLTLTSIVECTLLQISITKVNVFKCSRIYAHELIHSFPVSAYCAYG